MKVQKINESPITSEDISSYKEAISKLEGLLEAASKEKDDLRRMVLDLTKQVAELRVTVDFLRSENEKLETTLIKKPGRPSKTK